MPRKPIKKRPFGLCSCALHMDNFVISPSNSLHPVFFSFWRDKFCVGQCGKCLAPPKNHPPSPLTKQHSFPFSLFFSLLSFHPTYITSYQTHSKIAFIVVFFSYTSMCHLMLNHCTLHYDGNSLFSKATRS